LIEQERCKRFERRRIGYHQKTFINFALREIVFRIPGWQQFLGPLLSYLKLRKNWQTSDLLGLVETDTLPDLISLPRRSFGFFVTDKTTRPISLDRRIRLKRVEQSSDISKGSRSFVGSQNRKIRRVNLQKFLGNSFGQAIQMLAIRET